MRVDVKYFWYALFASALVMILAGSLTRRTQVEAEKESRETREAMITVAQSIARDSNRTVFLLQREDGVYQVTFTPESYVGAKIIGTYGGAYRR